MRLGPDITRIAALLGDPARANMLSALMSGQALTAGELAREAGVTPQTASSHLAKLEDGALLTRRRQGRHNYFALASPDVASEEVQLSVTFAACQPVGPASQLPAGAVPSFLIVTETVLVEPPALVAEQE